MNPYRGGVWLHESIVEVILENHTGAYEEGTGGVRSQVFFHTHVDVSITHRIW